MQPGIGKTEQAKRLHMKTASGKPIGELPFIDTKPHLIDTKTPLNHEYLHNNLNILLLQKFLHMDVRLKYLILILFISQFSISQTIPLPANSNTYTVPPGVTEITVEVWGAGGGGSTSNTAAGGGGGGYARSIITVSPGDTFNYTIGTAGTQGINGGDSTFNTTIVGGGGQAGSGSTGGAGGVATGGNDANFNGGNGGNAGSGGNGNRGGGGGGGSATAVANGGNGSANSGNTGGTGGAGQGNGGNGGNGNNGAGNAGSFPGGGGGGAAGPGGGSPSGNGASGQILVTQSTNTPPTINPISPVTTTITISEGDAINFEWSGSDSDGTILNGTWRPTTADALTNGTGSPGAGPFTATQIYTTAGTYTARVQVEDNNAGTAFIDITITVLVGQPCDGNVFTSAFTPTTSVVANFIEVPEQLNLYSDGSDIYSYGVGLDNNLELQAFQVDGTLNFTIDRLPDRVEVRRSGTLGQGPNGEERHILFFEQADTYSGSAKNFRGEFFSTMEDALLDTSINRGADNVFNNSGGTNINNIERIDYIFESGITIPNPPSEAGFPIFERGGNDNFVFAVIGQLDGTLDPSEYVSIVSFDDSDWTPTSNSITSSVVSGFPLDGGNLLETADLSSQETGVIFVSFEDMGLNAGDVIYGYSLAGGDATTNCNNFLDFNNPTFFPNTTSSGDGGLDLQAGGFFFSSNLLDTDNDNVPDIVDLDDDNDGIPDLTETGGLDPLEDVDGDGVPAFLDDDDTDETIGNDNNLTEEAFDADGDGTPNHLDLDSDNDGITDITENGGTDANNDGEVDYPTAGEPTSMTDVDGDGLEDALDNIDGGNQSGAGEVVNGTPLLIANTDSDSLPDYLDIDADNDGIPDAVEAQPTTGFVSPSGIGTVMVDVNNNGVDDAFEIAGNIGFTPLNTDGDSEPDYLDLNSDNDSLPDLEENGDAENTLSGTDTDGDGLDDNFDDVDDSATTASTVIDTHTPPNATNLGDEDLDAGTGGDVDYRDALELIATNDEIVFTEGVAETSADNVLDNDTVASQPANLSNVDITQLSTSNAGVTLDALTGLVSITNSVPFGEYTIQYQICDKGTSTNCTTATVTATVRSDNDGDGVSDDIDVDDDNDGILDIVENENTDPLADTDSDGTPDYLDTDATGFVDTNADGVDDRFDTDGDGVINQFDLDADNDGIPDNVEGQTTRGYVAPNNDDVTTYRNNNGLNTAYVSNPFSPVDTDGDGIPDYLDNDSDNDGDLDIDEAGLRTTDNDTNNDGLTDNSTGSNGLENGNGIETVDDYTDVNGSTHDGSSFQLQDTDNDVPNGADYDYRDIPFTEQLEYTRIITSLESGWVDPNKFDAYLNIVSNNWGVVLTRVNATAAISNPVEGMIIFDTSDNTFKVCIDESTPAWRALGN